MSGQSAEGTAFKHGVGRWAGTAEVYNGEGRFIGHALDQRNVQQVSANRLRIDLSFTGPLMLSGHYFIETHERHRLYRGPANVGYAETLDEGLVDAQNYWPHWGLSQRFFLYVTPDQTRQYALTLLSRGEQLAYMIIGENHRVEDRDNGPPVPVPGSLLIPGIPPDRVNDPTNGRGELLIHRAGTWSGTVRSLDATLSISGDAEYTQTITHNPDSTLHMQVSGGIAALSDHIVMIHSNGWQGWTHEGDVVGSYTLVGGRALSGQFHHLQDNLRVWRREVVASDGLSKVILHTLYRGGARIGVQYGLLHYDSGKQV